jgi:aldose 1-epimerase
MRRLQSVLLLAFMTVAVTASFGSAEKKSFGKTQDGQEVFVYTIKNNTGMEVSITNFGGVVLSIKVPDAKGQSADVALGFDNLADYEKQGPYFGALIGRYGNRIAKGHFTLDGKEYTLAINNPPNSLHGGTKGFDKRVWTPRIASDAEGDHLHLRYVSKDGEEGYPGTLTADVTYSVPANRNELLELTRKRWSISPITLTSTLKDKATVTSLSIP